MKYGFFISLILLSLLIAAIAGCGSGNSGNTALSSLAASEECIRCHATTNGISPVTGLNIVDEWKLSTHNSANGAGCRDCHGHANGHPNSCGGCHGGNSPLIAGFQNPDAAGKCNACHGMSASSYPLGAGKKHFDVYTTLDQVGARVSTATYVDSKNTNNCRSCHNPHDNRRRQQHQDWAKSGHGDISAAPWVHYDFKSRGTMTPGATPANTTSADCVRCHTATGYINYVSSGFTDIRSWGVAGDPTKQVLTCNACHEDGKGNAYSYKTRNVAKVTSYYNYSSALTKKLLIGRAYPDLGTSNICMPCHTGREIGDTVKLAAAGNLNFANAGFINSHYLSAGATVFGASGYTFPGRSYDSPSFQHNRIGLGNFLGTGSKGPCVGCHMSSGESHLFESVQTDADGNITAITSTICNGCHSKQSVPQLTATTLQAKKEGFQAALEALSAQLQLRGLYFYGANPYFFTAPYNSSYKEATASPHCTGNLSVKNWQTGGTATYTATFRKGKFNNCSSSTNVSGDPATGLNNMGAAFNYNLLIHEPGAFAHNSNYVKRLIYDSIDWLDNNQLDDSVATTLNALDNSTPYKANAIGYLLP